MLLRSPKHITDSVCVQSVRLSDCCINNALIRVTSRY